MDEQTTPRASEQGHFYDRQGRPVYEVMGKTTGKPRPTTIRDARTMQLVPGVTTITRCAAAPGLEAWKVKQAIMASLTLPRRPHEPEAEYLRRILEDSQEQGKQAAEEGTRIHAAIESRATDGPYAGHVATAYETLANNFGDDVEWECEHAFAHPMGYGSKIDLRGWRSRDKTRIIVDSKSKDWDDPGKPPEVYDEHGMQLAAYRHKELSITRTPRTTYDLPNTNIVCANLFVSRQNAKLACLAIWKPEDLDRCWEMFVALHRFWSIKNRYSPGWSS